jgi:hypothetical protein
LAALELTTLEDNTCPVDAVNLKNGLCDVETDSRDLYATWRLQIAGTQAAPTSMV